jgi:hypothetical protein
LPTYNGARKEANLTPLLALLLQRFGVPVLVHGLLEGFGRVTSGLIFRELGIMPMASSLQAEAMLTEQGLAFLPLTALCPGIHNLLTLRSRMGVRNSAHSLVKLLNPFHGEAVLVAPATHPDFIELMRGILVDRGERGLVLRGTEGEPFANPKRRPRLEYVHDGRVDVLFEAEHESLRALAPSSRCRGCGEYGGVDSSGDGQGDCTTQADRQSAGLLPVRQRLRRRLQSSQGHRRRRGHRASGRWQLVGKKPHQGKNAPAWMFMPVWCVTAAVNRKK